MDKVQEMYEKIGRIKDLLEEKAAVRIVMNPEKMVIKESERAFTYLNLFGYTVDCVIVNKIFPKESGDFLSEWVRMQEEYLKRIKESFPVPIIQIPFQRTEVVGERLFELAEKFFDFDPTRKLIEGKPIRVEKEGEFFVLSMKVPFVKKEDIEIYRRGEELTIVAGHWKRTIFLPQVLRIRETVGASYNNNELRIRFR